jgi:hypothetical protein
MPMEQQSPEMTAAGEKLFKLALERAADGMFCRCCSLRATANFLEPAYPDVRSVGVPGVGRIIGFTTVEPIVEAFISYLNNPRRLRQLETSAILGHAMILKAIGSEAANRIGQAYLERGINSSEVCAALLLWAGDHPELAAVTEKITLKPEIASALLEKAEIKLARPAMLINPAFKLRKRLSSELLSQCHVPTGLQEAIAKDNQPFAGELTSREVTAELHQILGHLEDPHLRRRIKDLIESMEKAGV